VSFELEHHRITVDGLAHHYVATGTGSPLLLLHGFPQTWIEWIPLMERLAEGFRIVAPDLRGLGGTVGPPGGYDKATLAADVGAIAAAEFGDARPIVCGHDIGAFVAFAYALKERDALAALILVDAPPPGTAAMDGLVSSNPRTWHLAFHSNVDVATMLIGGKEREYLTHFIRSRSYDQSALSDEDIDAYVRAYKAPQAGRTARAARRGRRQ
jgi:pimeloyl-ACP methyl ester carboxylesterase